jgi:uncharacterized protein (DUF433 family)/DNA-binding transcriptional MerR regulator
MTDTEHALTADLNGIYSVGEVCRILQPSMTPRKVHYWMDTALLSEPVSHGRRGVPTLLSFRQLLEIRTVQRLRDELEFSLPRVRRAFQFVVEHLFADHWISITFAKGVNGELVAQLADGTAMTIPGGQGVLSTALPELNAFVDETRAAWEAREFTIPGHPMVVTNTRVQAGSPTMKGTRIETSVLAAFAEDLCVPDTVEELLRMYPRLTPDAVVDAMEFEGVPVALS